MDEKDEKKKVKESEAQPVTLREETNGEQPQEAPTEAKPQAIVEVKPAEAALSAERVTELLSESGLDEDARRLLFVGAYTNEQAVSDAIAEFKRILKRASGSGQPFAQGAAQPAQKTVITEAERVKRYRQIKRQHGLDYPEV